MTALGYPDCLDLIPLLAELRRFTRTRRPSVLAGRSSGRAIRGTSRCGRVGFRARMRCSIVAARLDLPLRVGRDSGPFAESTAGANITEVKRLNEGV
jgi:hypothetical protein